jgi:peroxiredoxin Q/BCP
VLGISNDAPEKNKKFQEKYDFPFDLLSDEDLKVSIAYGAAYAGDGKASRISYLTGIDGKILKAYDKVKADEHPEEVLEDIREIIK